jgi:hypothetical protein
MLAHSMVARSMLDGAGQLAAADGSAGHDQAGNQPAL